MFFDYASYTSAFAWIATFGFKEIKETIQKLRARQKGPQGETINHQYTDRLNVLMRSYKEVPAWWYITLFLCSFVIIITIVAKGIIFIPVWAFIVALGTGAVVVLVGRFPDLSVELLLTNYITAYGLAIRSLQLPSRKSL